MIVESACDFDFINLSKILIKRAISFSRETIELTMYTSSR